MKKRTPAQVATDAGLRVGELRRSAGVTQEALADALGMSFQYLRRIEGGRVNMSIESLVRCARALNREPEELLKAPQSRARPKRGRPPGVKEKTKRSSRSAKRQAPDR